MADGGAVIRNRMREKIQAGGLALGCGVRQARTVDVVKMLKTAGYDWVFVDMEHAVMDLDVAINICNAAQDAGVTPVVRVPGYEHWLASKALDGGAVGIVFPHVDTAEQAAKLASFCRYPPDGKRSIGGLPPQLDFQSLPQPEMVKAVNAGIFVCVMVESPEAVANVDAIAAVPGVDAILIGTNDLMLEMGIPGQLTHDRVKDAYAKVIAACRAHGKIAGMGGVYSPPEMELFIGMGMQFVLCGNDFSFMMAGAKARHDEIRKLERS